MKIGLIADAPLITHSCAVVASQLAKKFVKLGHEVFYLGYNYTGGEYDHPDGYKIYPDTAPPTRRGSVKAFIEKTGVEILYSHGSKDIFKEGMIAAKEAGIPYVPHTFYSTPCKNDKVSTFEARSDYLPYDLSDVDDVAFCNNFSIGIGYTIGKRSWFIPNGVDTEIFYPIKEDLCTGMTLKNCPRCSSNYRRILYIQRDSFVFLFSGSNISGKDPGRALDAFIRFMNLDPSLDTYLAMHTRVGDQEGDAGRGMVNLRKVAKESGYADRVKFFTDAFPEWTDQPEADKNYKKTAFSPPYTTTPYELMGNVFRTGDVQLATTLMEGMSTTILEGMACGLPTICSDDPVVSEPVVNFSTGLLVHRLLTNENVTNEIVECMDILYSNPKLYRGMSENASRLVDIKYNWESIAQQLIYLFDTIIQKRYV